MNLGTKHSIWTLELTLAEEVELALAPNTSIGAMHLVVRDESSPGHPSMLACGLSSGSWATLFTGQLERVTCPRCAHVAGVFRLRRG